MNRAHLQHVFCVTTSDRQGFEKAACKWHVLLRVIQVIVPERFGRFIVAPIHKFQYYANQPLSVSVPSQSSGVFMPNSDIVSQVFLAAAENCTYISSDGRCGL